MNKSMIRYLLSKLLLIEAVLLLVPVAIAVYYRESSQVFTALFSTIGILVLLGGSGSLQKPKINGFMPRRSLDRCPLLDPLVFLWWSPLCLFWANPSLIDAFLKLVLGLQLLEQVFWTTFRFSAVPSSSGSFTHLIGGMGVLVLHLLLWTMPKIAT